MSTDTIYWFSAADLADLGRSGIIDIPASERWAGDKALKLEWLSRKVPGKGGKGGKRTEYQPPADVLAQIHAYLADNPNFFGSNKPRVSRQRSAAPAVPHKAEQANHAPYSVSPGTVALFDQQAMLWAEPAIRMAFIVRSMPRFANSPDDMLQRVSLLAFRFVFMFCDGDVQRIKQWLSDTSKTDGLVRMAYEGDCMKRGIAPGSDLQIKPE